jgi:hypothetical protein
MPRLTRRPSTVSQSLSASTPGEQATAIAASSQPTIWWLICSSQLCGTRWADSPRRKPGSRCGAHGRGWLGDCEACLVTAGWEGYAVTSDAAS